MARVAGSPRGTPARAPIVHQTNAAPAARACARWVGERTTTLVGGVKSTGVANNIAPDAYCPIMKGR